MNNSERLDHANALYAEQRWEEAQQIYRAMIADGEHVPDALYGLGMTCLVGRHDPATAERFFLEVLRVRPDHVNAMYRIGEVALSAGDRDSAVANFEQVLARNPTHAGARDRLSEILAPPQPAPVRRAGSPQPREPARPDIPRPTTAGGIVGLARNVRASRRWNGIELKFDLEQFDAAGHHLRSHRVTMKGQAIQGALSTGHWVEIPQRYNKITGPFIVAKVLRNLTTGREVATVISANMRMGIRKQTGLRIPPNTRW